MIKRLWMYIGFGSLATAITIFCFIKNEALTFIVSHGNKKLTIPSGETYRINNQDAKYEEVSMGENSMLVINLSNECDEARLTVGKLMTSNSAGIEVKAREPEIKETYIARGTSGDGCYIAPENGKSGKSGKNGAGAIPLMITVEREIDISGLLYISVPGGDGGDGEDGSDGGDGASWTMLNREQGEPGGNGGNGGLGGKGGKGGRIWLNVPGPQVEEVEKSVLFFVPDGDPGRAGRGGRGGYGGSGSPISNGNGNLSNDGKNGLDGITPESLKNIDEFCRNLINCHDGHIRINDRIWIPHKTLFLNKKFSKCPICNISIEGA